MYETLQLVLPAHVLRRSLPLAVGMGFHQAIRGSVFAIAERLLKDVFDDDGELSQRVAETLLESALLVLSDAVKNVWTGSEAQRTQAEKHLRDVLKFIDVHLSDCELSIAKVAKGCGISQRRLFALLKQHGTPFRALTRSAVEAEPGHRVFQRKPYGAGGVTQLPLRLGAREKHALA